MTQAEFNARATHLIRAFEKKLKELGEADARLLFREDKNLIYVRTHTVQAYFRRRRPRRRAA